MADSGRDGLQHATARLLYWLLKIEKIREAGIGRKQYCFRALPAIGMLIAAKGVGDIWVPRYMEICLASTMSVISSPQPEVTLQGVVLERLP